VVVPDTARGQVERGTKLGRRGVERLLHLGIGHPQRVDPAAVEPLGELAQRHVTAGTHVGDDGADGGERGVGRIPSVVRRGERAGRIGAAAEVEEAEHGSVIVTVTIATPGPEMGAATPRHDRCGWRRRGGLGQAGRMSSSSDSAELSSLQAQLDELQQRITAVGDRYRDTDDSAVAGELDQVERSLHAARRAVDRAVALLSD
jgi:hypothetical protein